MMVFDRDQVARFVEILQSGRENNLVYYMMLTCRDKESEKKIHKGIKIIQRAMKVHSELEKLEWLDRIYMTDEEFDMAAIYININPRSAKKALIEFNHEMIKTMAYGNPDYVKMTHRLKTCIHKASDNSSLVYYDVDTKDGKMIEKFQKILEPFKVGYSFCIETTNGYHLVFDRRKLKKLNSDLDKIKWDFTFQEKNRADEMVTKTYISRGSTSSVVIPGTYHRGFKASFVEFFEL